MRVSTAAMIVIGMLSVLNVLLTLGLARRLREHATELQRVSALVERSGVTRLVGRRVPEFQATTLDDSVVTEANVTEANPAGGDRLVGFFAVGCERCHEQAPVFAAAGAAALAVVAGEAADAADLVGILAGSVPVVAGYDGGRLIESFGVDSFPTLLRVDAGGVVVRADTSVHGVNAPIPA